jgi:Arc/MetJ-type ribon-helix-helix transcriptional regulator
VEKAKEKKKARGLFSSISFPTPLIKEIENIVEELGYWPTKTSFIREAVMEKLEKHRKELEARRARESAMT